MSDSCNPMDCSPPGFSVHGISQARVLEWVALQQVPNEFSAHLPALLYWNPIFSVFSPPSPQYWKMPELVSSLGKRRCQGAGSGKHRKGHLSPSALGPWGRMSWDGRSDQPRLEGHWFSPGLGESYLSHPSHPLTHLFLTMTSGDGVGSAVSQP